MTYAHELKRKKWGKENILSARRYVDRINASEREKVLRASISSLLLLLLLLIMLTRVRAERHFCIVYSYFGLLSGD